MATLRRLSLSSLLDMPDDAKPPLDPAAVSIGIVHLGLGAFHRAHQAVFTQNAMALSGETHWGICGSSQRSGDVVRQLRPQDCLYSVIERGGTTRVRVVGALREALFARDDHEALLARIADPRTHVVTLTVTEKGYRHDPATRRLRRDDEETKADTERPTPVTVVGQLVRGLQRRSQQGAGPLSIVCCDNLPSNGRTLRGLVDDFCDLMPAEEGAPLAEWIAANVTFPSTMVDRIVPAATAADRDEVARALQLSDEGVVVAEPFSQWVIEDAFSGPRPPWELAGARLVDDVAPYESMKLRLLNGSHSAMAYLGLLAGHERVADLADLDPVARYLQGLMAIDVTPTLDVPPGFDIERYQADLIERFRNHALGHRLAQIAMDGSQKLPQRLLAVMRIRLEQGAEPRFIALAVAAWMRFVSTGHDEAGAPLDIDDPLNRRYREVLARADAPAAVVEALLGMREIFDPELADDERAKSLLVDALDALSHKRSLDVVADLARAS